jgi:hypothetical protein
MEGAARLLLALPQSMLSPEMPVVEHLIRDRQHAADADAGGSKNDPKPGKKRENRRTPLLFPKNISLFSLCYLLLEKII